MLSSEPIRVTHLRWQAGVGSLEGSMEGVRGELDAVKGAVDQAPAAADSGEEELKSSVTECKASVEALVEVSVGSCKLCLICVSVNLANTCLHECVYG